MSPFNSTFLGITLKTYVNICPIKQKCNNDYHNKTESRQFLHLYNLHCTIQLMLSKLQNIHILIILWLHGYTMHKLQIAYKTAISVQSHLETL